MSFIERLPNGMTRGTPFKYLEYTLPNRNSVQELDQDADVRKAFWNVETRDVVIDIGAGFGGYTLCALGRGASFVFSFESNKELLGILRENLAANRVINAVERCATSDWNLGAEGQTLDKFFEGYSWAPPMIDWIKIDAGEEIDNFNILHGAQKTVKKYHPKILIRCSTPDVLKSIGYKDLQSLHGHTLAQQ